MMRTRELGVPFAGETGVWNAITDVAGVTVGHATLIRGEGPLVVGQGPVRTGVTAVLPRGDSLDPVFAGWYSLNGNGEMTGTTWVEESGFLEGPVLITNTHSVGIVRDAVVAWMVQKGVKTGVAWGLPVVAETYDGMLNDINGFHVTQADALAALQNAISGPVVEGNVGGGTGMVCHQFKGGIGTASRVLPAMLGGYTVGVLVQANYGRREQLTIAGVPVGQEITDLMPEWQATPAVAGAGSIIIVIATDAPLLPHQLKRLARRVPLGIARMGGVGADSSGDIFIAFSTANPEAHANAGVRSLNMLPNPTMTPLFEATVQATEEAIVNAMVAAQTMTGVNGNQVYALPHDRLRVVLQKYNRLISR